MKNLARIFKIKTCNTEVPYWIFLSIFVSLLLIILNFPGAKAQNLHQTIEQLYNVVKKNHTKSYIHDGNIFDTCYVLNQDNSKIHISKSFLILYETKNNRHFYWYDVGSDGFFEVVVVTKDPLLSSEEYSLKLVGLKAYTNLKIPLELSKSLHSDKSPGYKSQTIFVMPLSEVYDFETQEIFNLPEKFRKELIFRYKKSLENKLVHLTK